MLIVDESGPLNPRSQGDALVGMHALHGSRSKNSATFCWIFGIRVMPPTRIASSTSAFVRRASESVCLQMSMVRSMRSAESSSSVARSIVRCR